MKLTIIAGSQRHASQSLNVANYLAKLATTEFTHVEVQDLFTLNLPFWNEGVWQGSEQWAPWQPIAQRLKQSDAFIFITPEWHGMATPALKNFLLLTTHDELSHKPALLASVSASINGVYPISELRMTGSKNNHVCYLPDHLIFRNIETLLDTDGALTDPTMAARCQYSMTLLSAYAKALASVHEAMLEAGKPFRYGM